MSPWLRDSAERVASAFLLALASTLLLAGTDVLSLSTWHAAAVAGVTAALVAVKSLVAARIGGTVSPASLAPAVGLRDNFGTPESDGALAVKAWVEAAYARHGTTPEAVEAALNRRHRLSRLPAASGPKLGHLPSPRDDRDWQYKHDKARVTETCHNAAGLTFDALGNLQIGDCAEAGIEHLRQVVAHLAGKTYTPTLAGTIALYEKFGYRPGDPNSDQGTVLRQMLAELKREGVVDDYEAVALDTGALRSAIAVKGGVLCGFALPEGAESEGVKWRVPRTGKAAGSWGGHCVPLVGSTSELYDHVSWGEVGTISHGFVKDYLDEAWVVTFADTALSA